MMKKKHIPAPLLAASLLLSVAAHAQTTEPAISSNSHGKDAVVLNANDDEDPVTHTNENIYLRVGGGNKWFTEPQMVVSYDKITMSKPLGIGTASPSGNLEVKNGLRSVKVDLSSTDALLKLTSNSVGNWTRLGTNGSPFAIVTDGNDASSSTPSLFITSDRVGIGTTSPNTKLEINNGSAGNAIRIVDGNQGAGKVLTSDMNGFGTWTNAGNPWYQFRTASSFAGNGDNQYVTGKVFIGQSIGIGGDNIYNPANTAANDLAAPLTVAIPDLATARSTPVQPAIRMGRSGTYGTKWAIAADLKLGSYISATSATTPGASAASQLDIALANGNTNVPDVTVMSLLGNGKVGIGTTTPAGQLDVVNGDRYVRVDLSTTDASLLLKSAHTYNWSRISSSGSHLAIVSDGNDANPSMFISNYRNVGIGTTSPAARLEVNNGTSGSAIKIVDGTQGAGKLLTSDANGLASWTKAASPWYKIRTASDVAGNADGQYVTGNVFIGQSVGGGVDQSFNPANSGLNDPAAPLTLCVSGAAVPGGTATQPALRLGRSGTTDTKYALAADFKLGSYATSGVNSAAQLDIALSNSNASPNTTVMSLLGNGNVGIGTNSPSYKLDVKDGNVRALTSTTTDGTNVAQHNLAGFITSLDILNTTTNTTKRVRGVMSMNSYSSGSGEFLNIETLDPGVSIKFDVGNANNTVMELFENQVLIGPNLPNLANGVIPFSGLNYALGVRGRIVSESMTCKALSAWGDFVFDESYKPMSLAATEQYIKANKHLPGVPSAAELENKGVDVYEMLKIQMQKIEELTLHSIEQQKLISKQQAMLEQLSRKVK